MVEPYSIDPTTHAVWRVGRIVPEPSDRYEYRRPDPVVPGESRRQGNRFDSFSGRFGTLYFGSSLEVCYAETLARFRPNPALVDLVRDDWVELGGMPPGNVAADWRARRIITRVRLPTALPLIDVRHPDTLAALNADQQLMSICASVYNVHEIDLATVCGPDRRITRLIAEQFATAQSDDGDYRWSGLVYSSRLGTTESGEHDCWAIFEGTEIEELESQSILRNDETLRLVAERFSITVH